MSETLSGTAQAQPDASLQEARRQPLALIAAVAANGVIGRDGGLPWHLPADLRHFKALTSGKRIIMGRRTWQSFPRPLPQREHVVISSQDLPVPQGVLLARSLPQALRLPGGTDPVFVIGGGRVYQEALPLTTDVYLTEIEAQVVGDAHFPPWNREAFAEISRETHVQDIEGIGASIRYSFVHYQRKATA